MLIALLLMSSPASSYQSIAVAPGFHPDSFDPDATWWGYAWDNTSEEAQGFAWEACDANVGGNAECKVVLTYDKACGALVGTSDRYGTGVGKTEAEAESAAKVTCPGCALEFSDCDN